MQRKTIDHEEIEWQFEAADLEKVESWLEQHPSTSDLALVPGATKKLIDTYYDTEDWRLYRAGYALRLRREGENAEATMKSLAPAENALRRRREISVALRSGAAMTLKKAPGPIGERLRRLAGEEELRPLFEVRTRRRRFALHPERSPENAAIGEVALDESEISSGKAPIRLSRVEVEIEDEFHGGVEEFVDGLRKALGLRPTEASKFETGLSAAGLDPPNFGEKDGR